MNLEWAISISTIECCTTMSNLLQNAKGCHTQMCMWPSHCSNICIVLPRICSNILVFFPIFWRSETLVLGSQCLCGNQTPSLDGDLIWDLYPKQTPSCCYSISLFWICFFCLCKLVKWVYKHLPSLPSPLPINYPMKRGWMQPLFIG